MRSLGLRLASLATKAASECGIALTDGYLVRIPMVQEVLRNHGVLGRKMSLNVLDTLVFPENVREAASFSEQRWKCSWSRCDGVMFFASQAKQSKSGW